MTNQTPERIWIERKGKADLAQKTVTRDLARIALTVFTPNNAITDTVWMADAPYITLYEHVISMLGADMTGDPEQDEQIIREIIQSGVVKVSE